MNTQEAEIMDENPMPIAVRQNNAVGVALTPEQIQGKPPITASQAKVEAVASLTMAAYQRAATLALTPEESQALLADFPDEAFQPGAAGKEHLLYIEHAHLRDRFTQVFGMGQWAIIPRNRWNEPFTVPAKRVGEPDTQGERVYVEAMLVVRGCFVGEAVGAMEYYPKNAAQNYGDAVEGAKTAAFRRCAKEFGVGLQAWKKEWCEGWWVRKREKMRQNALGRAGSNPPAQRGTPQPTGTPTPAQQAGTSPKSETVTPKHATDETRKWMLDKFNAAEGMSQRQIVTDYFIKVGQILPNETLEELPLQYVPVSKAELAMVAAKISKFEDGEEATAAFPPHDVPAPTPTKQAEKPIAVPRENVDKSEESEAWRAFPMPFGKNAGVPLAELEKNYLFGLWANFTVETEYNGKPKKAETIERDTEFRQMLDAAGEHYQFEKKH